MFTRSLLDGIMDQDTLLLLLNVGIFAPLIGIPLIALFPERLSNRVAIGISLGVLGIGIAMMFGIMGGGVQLNENGYWLLQQTRWFGMDDLDIKYIVGVDGVSGLLLLLTALIFPLMALYQSGKEVAQPKLFFVMFLLLETGLLGYFASLDLMMMYVFFELVLIPASFLIGIWGDERRGEAALKFFLYTLVGSLMMLIGIIYLGIQVAEIAYEGASLTTDYFVIQETLLRAAEGPADGPLGMHAQLLIFLAFVLSFAIKSPLFPFHTWQPLAYASASTTGSVILGALMSKMGAYGFVRFCLPLFPAMVEAHAPILSGLAVAGLLYGAYVAVGQGDIKRLIAYSSLSHMGFILLGIFSGSEEALQGAILQMIAHGVTTTALFILVDIMERRYGSRMIADFQGIAKSAPIFTFLFMVSVMASVGLPGLSGFVGEFMIMLGAFQGPWLTTTTFAILSAVGVILAAVYLLNMFRKAMFGTPAEGSRSFTDARPAETLVLVPLLILMFWIGLYATPFLRAIDQQTILPNKQMLEQLTTDQPDLNFAS